LIRFRGRLKEILMRECGSMDENMDMAERLGQIMQSLREIMKMIRNMAKGFCF